MKKYFPFIAIFFLTTIIFWQTLSLYFVQDDFLFLVAAKEGSLQNALSFILPRSDVVWYRPLSSQYFFFFCMRLFGANPWFYHAVMLLTHAINIVLVFRLSNLLTKNRKTAILASLLYALSANHFITLSWSATYSFILGPTFMLLTLICFFSNMPRRALLFFGLGLLSSEIVVSTIIPLIYWEVAHKKSCNLKALLQTLGPYVFFIGVLVVVRKILFPVSFVDAYQLVFSSGIISLFRFYLIRTIGLPMLIKNSGAETNTIITLLLGLLFTIGIVVCILQRGIKKIFYLEQIHVEPAIILSLCMYLSSLLPFLFLPNHYSPHYLTFAMVGVSLFFSVLLSSYPRIIQFALVACFVSLQFLSVQITYNTHWIVSRAHLAQKLVSERRFLHPVGSEEYFALGANRAAEFFSDSQNSY